MAEPKLTNQVFPLITNSKCNLTVDADPVECSLVHCVADGTIAVTFSDGIQNGDETGVDCGGSCPACSSTGGTPISIGTMPISAGTTPITVQ